MHISYIAILLFYYIIIVSSTRNKRECIPPKTTASGSKAPNNFCKGDLIFQDNFDWLDPQKWKHEVSFFGFGNNEFEWYTDDKNNSFTKDGKLFIKPTLTSDFLGGADKLKSQTIDLGSKCTTPNEGGCKLTGNQQDILKPIRSARMKTLNSFRFKYGRVEIRAQMPTGDWLWPALWFLPAGSHYGIWPRSGEIDLVESRGNVNYKLDGSSLGVDSSASTLHWGPDAAHNGYKKTQYERHTPGDGGNKEFRVYELTWTPDYIQFTIDGHSSRKMDPGQGFWNLGGFAQQGFHDNIWKNGGKMAPFDQEFYIILNLAIGGTNGFFPDAAVNQPYPKPWKNNAPHAMTDFWNARNNWLPTWNLGNNNGYDASLKIDYVKVWAI